MRSFRFITTVSLFFIVSGCDRGSQNHLVAAYPATAETPHFVGAFESGKKALVSKPGEVGLLAYGPYISLKAGKYVAAFTITATGTTNGEILGEADVNGFTKARPENLLGKSAIRASTGEQIIPVMFSADDIDKKFEFRISTNGRGTIGYKSVEVKKFD